MWSREYQNPTNCELVAGDLGSVERELWRKRIWELDSIIRDILFSLSEGDKLRYKLSDYCSDYNDYSGRIRFIMRLVEDKVIVPLQIPEDYFRHKSLKGLIDKSWSWSILKVGEEGEGEERALTDEIEVIRGEVEVLNPRWELVEGEGENRDYVYIGEKIRLKVDVRNYPEGGPVTFDIYDVTEAPPLRIATVRGKNDNGTGRGEWVIEDPNGRGEELKIEFEGIVRSKASERVEIPIGRSFYVFSV